MLSLMLLCSQKFTAGCTPQKQRGKQRKKEDMRLRKQGFQLRKEMKRIPGWRQEEYPSKKNPGGKQSATYRLSDEFYHLESWIEINYQNF